MAYRYDFKKGEIIPETQFNENFLLLKQGVALDPTAINGSNIASESIDMTKLAYDVSAFFEQTANKDMANGYPSLDASGLIPLAEIPLLTTVQEVIDARGTKSALNERMSVSLNPDGTLKSALKVDILDHGTPIVVDPSAIDFNTAFTVTDAGYGIAQIDIKESEIDASAIPDVVLQSGSITQITTRDHSDLQNKQLETDIKHVTDAEKDALDNAVYSLSSINPVADKQYVDLSISALDATSFVRRDGTTPLIDDWNVGGFAVTGLLDPTASDGVATKNYVDINIPSVTVTSLIAGGGIEVNPPTGLGNVEVINTGVLSLTAGSNINIDATSGHINISSIGSAPITSLIAGNGIQLDPTSGLGDVEIINTGVTSLIAGDGINVDVTSGNITINSTVNVPVTSLIAGEGITLDPTSGLGNIEINAIQLWERDGSGLQPYNVGDNLLIDRILFDVTGMDVNLYKGAANLLKTDDSLLVVGNILGTTQTSNIGSASNLFGKIYLYGSATTNAYGLQFGTDTFLYHSGSGQINIDNHLIVSGNIRGTANDSFLGDSGNPYRGLYLSANSGVQGLVFGNSFARLYFVTPDASAKLHIDRHLRLNGYLQFETCSDTSLPAGTIHLHDNVIRHIAGTLGYDFYNSATSQLWFSMNGTNATLNYQNLNIYDTTKKLIFNADTNLYRGDANQLKTDDDLFVTLDLDVSGTTTLTGVASYVAHPTFNADTQLVDKLYVDTVSATDQLVRISATDVSSDFLNNKLIPGSHILTNISSAGSNEKLNIYVDATGIDHNTLTNYAANRHFLQSDIDHTNLQNKGVYAHSVIDSHIDATATVHGIADTSDLALKSGSITQITTRNHNDLLNIGENDHHNRLHDLDSTADHSGTLSWEYIDASGSSLTDITTRVHSDLTDKDADDHTQYYNAIRHDVTGSHTLGTVVPHDALSSLTDVVITYPQDDQELIYSAGKWINVDSSATEVDSFNGRTGVVVSETNDYTWSQIDKTVSSLADITTRNHTDLLDVTGTYLHSAIDSHIDATGNIHGIVDTSDLVLKSGDITQITTRDHDDLENITTDNHHNMLHTLDSTADHSGTLSWVNIDASGSNLTDITTRNHSDLQNIGIDDHHDQVHTLLGTDHTQTGITGYLYGDGSSINPITKISLTTDVSGVLPIANGGTGQSDATAAFDALAPTTAQGDLIVYNGTDNVRLPNGTTGQVLVADPTGSSPYVKWESRLNDIQSVKAYNAQTTTSTSYVDVPNMTLTTKDLDTTGTYLITFTAGTTNTNDGKLNSFIVNIDGTEYASSETVTSIVKKEVGWVATIAIVANVANNKVIKIQWKTDANTATIFNRVLAIHGVANSTVAS